MTVITDVLARRVLSMSNPLDRAKLQALVDDVDNCVNGVILRQTLPVLTDIQAAALQAILDTIEGDTTNLYNALSRCAINPANDLEAAYIATIVGGYVGGGGEPEPEPDPPPTASSDLAVAITSATALAVTWQNNHSDGTAVIIEHSTNGSDWEVEDTLAASAESYNDTGLSASSTHYYRVRVYRSTDDQYSDYSNSDSAVTAPAAPSGLAVTIVSASELQLDWTDNSPDETSFSIERSPNGSSGWTEVLTPAADDEQDNDTGLSADTTYYYRIKALRSGDSAESAYSDTASAATAPAAPSDLTATADGSDTIDLSWTDNSSTETAFHIERSTTGSGVGFSEIDTVSAGVEAYEDTGLDPETEYFYRVRAYRSGDTTYSAYSDEDSDTTGASAPAAPSSLAATANVADANAIDLAWTDDSDDETSFSVEQSPNGTDSWVEVATPAANATSVQITGLTPETTYYFRMRAYRSGDTTYSSYSNTDNDTTISLQAEYYYYMITTLTHNAFYKFNESAGTAIDNTGANGATSDGTITGGGYTLNVTTSPPGNFKQYIDFDGSDDTYINIPNDAALLGSDSDDWTLGICFRADAFYDTNTSARFIVKGFNWFVQFQVNEKYDIKVDAGTDMTWIDNTGNYIDGVWRWLFITIEGGTDIEAFISDGAGGLSELTAGSESAGALPMANPTTDLRLMNRVGTADLGLDGGLASFFVYEGLLATATMETIITKSGVD